MNDRAPEPPRTHRKQSSGGFDPDQYRMTIGEHLDVLSAAGFDDVRCALDLGAIACIVARREDGAAQ